MRAVLIFFSLLLLISCVGKKSLHEKFPEELLTEDFGILTQKDLFNKTYVYPIGKLDTQSSPAPRWFCFENKENIFKAKCIPTGKNEEIGEIGSELEMKLKSDEKVIEYYFDRNISHEVCEEHRLAWKKIMEGEKYFCVSARLMEVDTKNTNKIQGAFDKLKTKKGCDSLFIGQCD